ncbi:MAG: potassium channel family protein [Actinomycetia bacterium]|nr:potassium channel family protein [Actinomycetes bacterium]
MHSSSQKQGDDERQQRFDAAATKAEIPMLVLSGMLIFIVLVPLFEDLSGQALLALEIVGLVIWAGFTIEYVVLLYLAPDKWEMVRTHKLDLVLVVLPLLRPFRVGRVLRLVRAGSGGARAFIAVRRLARRPGFGATMAVIAGMIIIGGGMASIAEHDQPNSTISGVGDGLWWAFVTCTTVGYGDEVPVTATGRFIAVGLILAGIGALSVITANIAAFFVANETEDEEDTNELARQLDRIECQLSDLRQDLEHRPASSTHAELS